MIEKKLINYLKGKLSCPVYMEIPPVHPSKYVLMYKLTGGQSMQIKYASFNFECVDESLVKAAELCEEVKATLFAADSIDDVFSVTLGGETNNTDANTKTYRYECVFNFNYF